MGRFLSNRDGGKTDELGHNFVLKKAFTGNVVSGFVTSQAGTPALSVEVTPGQALIEDGDKKYEVWADSTQTIAISTPHVSNPRKDYIVAYVDTTETPSPASPNNPTIFKFAAVAGTPAGSPSVPSVGQIQTAIGAANPYAIIAEVLVGAGVTTITNANITDRRTLLQSNLTPVDSGGWTSLAVVPTTISPLGKRSFTVTIPGIDYTSKLAERIKLKFKRAVTAPYRAASLNGSSQYFSKASPAGTTFLDDWAGGAWVYLTSYQAATIISRFNGSSGWAIAIDSNGRPQLIGYNASGSNFSEVKALESIPLNKWVHIAGQLDMSAFTATTTTSYLMIDGQDVPAVVARGGTNPTALVQAGDLQVGALNGANFFPGKIAQPYYSSAKITQANQRTLMGQGITSSLITTNSIVSAFSLDNTGSDLNTTNANNLSAVSSAGYTADSPFAGGARSYDTAGTTDFAVITSKPVFSTDTTFTVQVPEGHVLPTSGGFSEFYYSRDASPFGMPIEKSRYKVESILRILGNQGSPTDNVWYNPGSHRLNVPLGSWNVGWKTAIGADRGAATSTKAQASLSTSSSAETRRELTVSIEANSVALIETNMAADLDLELSTSTLYYLIARVQGTGHSNVYNLADRAKGVIEAIPNFI